MDAALPLRFIPTPLMSRTSGRVAMRNTAGLILGEKSASLFQPDTLLAAQYADLYRRKSYLEPEKRLMFAILEDAINCFQKYLLAKDENGKKLYGEAEEWILEKNGDWPFSFDHICEALGFNPNYICQGLVHWKEKKLAGGSKAKIYRLNPAGKKTSFRVIKSGGKGNRLLKAVGC